MNADGSVTVTISQEAIQAKAEELFDIYQKAMNRVSDTYCKKFEYLERRVKDAWIDVATRVLTS